MNLHRMWAIFVARNAEFFRDRASFGWNFAFPFLIIVGFGIIFNGREFKQFKVGVFPPEAALSVSSVTSMPDAFRSDRHIILVPVADKADGETRLSRHQISLLIDATSPTHAYWLNDSSPDGSLAERIYLASFMIGRPVPEKGVTRGGQIRYIDWLMPGILAMNMMFSALWGVGYVIVRYRKNGALKRLRATPLTALEYLSAQMFSRICLILFTLCVVWIGADLLFHFQVRGSLLLLFAIFALGGLNLCSIGLILAARGTSEEFASGVLNFITWPMMFLSEVWFSLEGSPAWVNDLSRLLPLTHLLTAARRVMNEGGTFADVHFECGILLLGTVVALVIAATLFSWNE
ncbi:ABC transporter permease [Desulfoprunum benzoelyticum]|uniref:ABC-type multidrug transport system permease subunit n=1 Tax=Desulfoprunum benzoelyticum TaxID=1506996 RepID=A0A840V2Q3_9BACT|nr:ABC transporter permease [Desulfoprunum benzoelyticum]MBB5348150.1 ABC-type multidrug transport system permease subunit [Desulfoprunum benzoelyticum]MBM9530240.1 ABC transporter permease [Desulfoprunum benzoelyticum]